jgi:hypothetical protein
VSKAEAQTERVASDKNQAGRPFQFRGMRIIKKTHLIWSEPNISRNSFRKRALLKERLKNYFSQVAKVFAIVAAILMVVSLFCGQSLGDILVANFFSSL